MGQARTTFLIVPGLRNFILNGLNTGDLTIDDSGDTANATYTITPTTVQISGWPAIPYAGATSLTVLGGSGTDTFNVQEQRRRASRPIRWSPGLPEPMSSTSPRKDKELLDIQGDLDDPGPRPDDDRSSTTRTKPFSPCSGCRTFTR